MQSFNFNWTNLLVNCQIGRVAYFCALVVGPSEAQKNSRVRNFTGQKTSIIGELESTALEHMGPIHTATHMGRVNWPHGHRRIFWKLPFVRLLDIPTFQNNHIFLRFLSYGPSANDKTMTRCQI